jgi:hypothetical protein
MSSLGLTAEEVISTVLTDGKKVASTTESPEEDLLPLLVENYLKWKEAFKRRDTPAWGFFKTVDEALTPKSLKSSKQYKLKCIVCTTRETTIRGKGTIKFVAESGSKSLITHAKKHEALYLRLISALTAKRALLDGGEESPEKKWLSVLDQMKEGSKAKYDKFDPKQMRFERDICYLVCKDLAPFRVIDHEGFVKLVYHLDPKITVPSTWYLTNTLIPQLRKDTVDGYVKPLLASADYVSFSFDLWMSKGNEDIYSLVAHILSENWELKTVFLALADVKASTGAVLSASVFETMTAYKLTDKAVSCVVDGGANVRKACQELRSKMFCGALKIKPFLGKCWAHILNTVLKKMLTENK